MGNLFARHSIYWSIVAHVCVGGGIITLCHFCRLFDTNPLSGLILMYFNLNPQRYTVLKFE